MKTGSAKKINIRISDGIGKIPALILEAPDPKFVLVLAHGAGAGMEHPFMESLARLFAESHVTTVRFNFPYMANKKGRPDPPAIAEKTVAMVLDKAHALFPNLHLFSSGKSFGGRMTSQRVAKECPPYLRGIIFFGFPLHAPGKPSMERASHLNNIAIPLLFLQGTRDALAELSLIKEVASGLSSCTLITFENADHSFKAGKENLIPLLVEKSVAWMEGK
jgi:uncharacterized protein